MIPRRPVLRDTSCRSGEGCVVQSDQGSFYAKEERQNSLSDAENPL